MKLKPEHFYQAEQNGIDYRTLYNRVNNRDWDIDKAINTPVERQGSNSVEVKTEKEIIIEELNALSYYDTEGKTLKELSTALFLERIRQVKVGSPHSGWF